MTSNHEPACVAAEAIALDLGLRAPGSGPAVLLRDKIAMRTRLAGHDQLGSAWAEISGPDDIRAAAQVVGYPMIVKTSRG